MSQNVDSILIKNNSGQLRTVNLSTPKSLKHESIKTLKQRENNQKGLDEIDNLKQEIESELSQVNLPEKKFPEKISEPKLKEDKILQAIPVKEAASSFYFNLDDEKEVSRFRNGDKITKRENHSSALNSLADRIILKANLSADEAIKERIRKIINSRLRDVRGPIETRLVLMRNKELGGMGLNEEEARNILTAIDKEKENLKDFLAAQENVAPKEREEKIRAVPQKKFEPSKMDMEKFRQEIKQTVPQPKVFDSQGMVPPKINQRPSVFVEQEPIKTISKAEKLISIMGPVDELANFNLEAFRALGNNGEQRVKQIKNKIEMLTDESFEKRDQGISAWRSSAVYQDYLGLGQASLEQNKSVQEIINARQSSNQPTLNFEEFEAVSDLNESLSY